MNKILHDKKLLLLLLIALSVVVIGLSFAYFVMQSSEAALTDVNVGTDVSEKLIFTKGEDLNIIANQENFAEGDGSISGTTASSATLIANKSAGSASRVYNIYFDISKNNFVYTVDANTPELLLKIVDPSGNEITSIDGFTHKTIIDSSTGETLTGFDITTFNGLFIVKEDEAITTTSYTDGTTENWSATITFVNLNTDQVLNEGKSLDADFILTEDKIIPNEMISGTVFNELMKTTGFRDTITQIVFDKQIDANYETAVNKWDLSEAGNEEIVGYIENNGAEQILHIQSNRRIFANTVQFQTFSQFSLLTSLEFNDWYNTSNVTNMIGMFAIIPKLSSLDVSSLDTSSVTNMIAMFQRIDNISHLDLSTFDTSNVTHMGGMFAFSPGFINIDLSNFNTSNVVDMSSMFYETNMTSLDLSHFDTSNVTTMEGMFYNSAKLAYLNIDNFDTSKVTTMEGMFTNTALTELNLSSFDTSNVTTMTAMFRDVKNISNLDLSSFNTSNVTIMNSMFYNMSSLESIDISSFNTSKVTNMGFMFRNTASLDSLDLSHFNTSNVTSMTAMFYDAKSLTSLNLSSFNTAKVTDMSFMFRGVSVLTTLDLSSFDTSLVTTVESMFSSSPSLIGNLNAKTQADADTFNNRAETGLTGNATFIATE